jgi:hypothetical protein
MARMNANDHATAAPDIIPPNDYLCGITGVVFGETQNGKRYLELTVMTEDGQIMTDRVFGMEDKGKGPWIQRVIAKLAMECAASFAAVPNVPAQPCEDMDWESESDVQAAILGGVIWLKIEVEPGGEKPTGGYYADKNKGSWGFASAAAAADKDRYRKSAAWLRALPRVKDIRAEAVKRWQIAAAAARNPAPVATPAVAPAPADDGFIDDGIPF